MMGWIDGIGWLGMDPDEGGGWSVVDWAGEENKEVAADGMYEMDGRARTRV